MGINLIHHLLKFFIKLALQITTQYELIARVYVIRSLNK